MLTSAFALALVFVALAIFGWAQISTISVIASWIPLLLTLACLGAAFLLNRSENVRDVLAIFAVAILAVAFGIHYSTMSVGVPTVGLCKDALYRIDEWSLAWLVVGVLGGFLFGIPRVLQGSESGGAGASPSSSVPSTLPAQPPYQQRVNTNLEQISDWLTKIIVGLGLVELRSIPRHMHELAGWMASGITTGDPDRYAPSCAAIVIYFSIIGFLVGYLLTRLFLADAFRRADQPRVITAPSESYAGDQSNYADLLRNWWKPGGVVDLRHQAELEKWLKSNGIEASMPTFIYGKEYEAKRALAVTALKIPAPLVP